MSVPIAYLAVILIWSTTPLGIQWSGINGGFAFGVALRMGIGLIALLAIVYIRKLRFPWHQRARQVYYASGFSLLIAMSLVYWSAQYIPSGWIAVIFGLSPIFTSIFSAFILKENVFTASRIIGMLLGLCGLIFIFIDSLNLAKLAWAGIIGVVFSAMAQSLGAVIINKQKPEIPAISITAGGLIIALPGFIINIFIQGGVPASISIQTFGAIIYLAILGTATGFPLYYFLLKNISAERIALITLITPVTALLIGAGLNGESISTNVWSGTLLIVSGLAIYEYGKYLQPFHLS